MLFMSVWVARIYLISVCVFIYVSEAALNSLDHLFSLFALLFFSTVSLFFIFSLPSLEIFLTVAHGLSFS